jgi:hypothetical protein
MSSFECLEAHLKNKRFLSPPYKTSCLKKKKFWRNAKALSSGQAYCLLFTSLFEPWRRIFLGLTVSYFDNMIISASIFLLFTSVFEPRRRIFLGIRVSYFDNMVISSGPSSSLPELWTPSCHSIPVKWMAGGGLGMNLNLPGVLGWGG